MEGGRGVAGRRERGGGFDVDSLCFLFPVDLARVRNRGIEVLCLLGPPGAGGDGGAAGNGILRENCVQYNPGVRLFQFPWAWKVASAISSVL
jgi:hypothetical protein